MKKVFLSLLLLSGVTIVAKAATPKDDLIPVYPPCGDVVYLDPANYKDADALIRRAWEIGNAPCDNEVK